LDTSPLSLSNPEAQAQAEAANKLHPLGEKVRADPADPQTPKLPFVTDELRSCTGHFSVGCYGDEAEHTRTWYHKVIPKGDQKAMTVQVCYDFCQQVPFAQFFGLVHGRECWCAHYYDKGATTDGFCDLPCEGNANEVCGGKKLASVHEMHDCNNLPAKICHGAPPPISNAAQTCGWGDTAAHSYCHVECIPGYEIGEDNLRCKEFGNRLVYSWASWSGTTTCVAKNCGPPTNEPHTRHPTADVYFPNSVQFQCQLGYSIDRIPQGNRTFSQTCQTTGQLTPSVPCLPVLCGAAPVLTKACRKKYVMIVRGVLQNVTSEHCAETPAEASPTDLHYTDVAKYECMKGYTTNAVASGPKEVQSTCGATGEFSSPPACRAVICGAAPTTPNGEVTGPLAHNPTDLVRYPTAVPYTCLKGYTLDGSARYVPDNTQFSRKCTHRGTFSRAFGSCQPVQCGMPPDIEHGQVQKASLVYSQQAVYTCATGYTVDGEVTGSPTITLTCGFRGTFEKEDGTEQIANPSKCIPVSCGNPQKIAHAKVTRGANSQGGVSRFGEVMLYTADVGYSTSVSDNPYKRTAAVFQVSCLANGQFSPATPLVNIDDCLVHNCGTHGTCRDLTAPTNKPNDNYVCDCHSGYETRLNENGEKRCRNINDCPLRHACADHGLCVDLVNDYRCDCDSGFTQVAETNGRNMTCAPVICGTPEPASHTTHEFHRANEYPKVAAVQPATTKGWFGTEVKYACDDGYSLDGDPVGPRRFTVSCMNTGVFTARNGTCQPVNCGAPPTKAHAVYNSPETEVVFKGAMGNIRYSCETGYTLNGQAGGPSTFQMSCETDGAIKCQTSSGCECQPVNCPAVPTIAEAGEISCEDRCGAPRVFPEVVTYQCSEGWSTNGNAGNPKVQQFTVSCQADGRYSALGSCQRVTCGAPPVAVHQSRGKSAQASAVFEDELTYTCDTGYTLDGEPGGPKKYGVVCESTGAFSPTRQCLPVNCGTPPAMDFATVPSADVRYTHSATYTCNQGYSTDGFANGARTFTRACEPAGHFAEGGSCKPISCGALTPPAHSQLSATGDLVYTETVTVTCDPGYTLTGLPEGDVTAVVTCQAPPATGGPSGGPSGGPPSGGPPSGGPPSGGGPTKPRLLQLLDPRHAPFSSAPVCVNIDDCSPFGITCGTHGTCIDNPNPTGDHDKDYHCQCESGFEERTGEDGKRFCGNTPDCPPNACQPGTCRDLVNDYTCECPVGYHEEKSGTRRDCKPNVCGNVPSVANAITSRTGQIAFPSTINYKCQPGFTVDGSVTGATAFDMGCQANKTFSNSATSCQPITCGDAPTVSHATKGAGPMVMHFGQTNQYTCNSGYSLDGSSDGQTSFTVKCEKTGRIANVKQCRRVVCQQFPTIANAKYSTAKVYFGDNVTVTCLQGFTTTPRAAGGRVSTMTCNANGGFDNADIDCKKVKCDRETLPEVANSEFSCGYQRTGAVQLQGTQMEGRQSAAAAKSRCEAMGAICVGVNQVGKLWHPVAYDGPASTYSILTGVALLKKECEQELVGCFKDMRADLFDMDPQFSRENVTVQQARRQCEGRFFTGIHAGEKVFCANSFSKSQPIDDCQCGRGGEANAGRLCVYNTTRTRFGRKAYGNAERYMCVPGYSLDGSAGGPRDLMSRCQANGEHAEIAGSCQRITCGQPPVVANAEDVSTTPLLYGDKVSYSCKPGYSVDGISEYAVLQAATPPPTTIVDGPEQITRNKHMGTITSSQFYELEFTIHPTGITAGWGNIFHFGRSNTEREPAVWFWPRSTRLHFRAGNSVSWNSGCDPQQQLPLNTDSIVKVVMQYGKLEVSVNGIPVCTEATYARPAPSRANHPVQLGRGSVAQAKISNLVYTPLRKITVVDLLPEPFKLERNTVIGSFLGNSNWDLTFDITLHSVPRGYASVLHFTNGHNMQRYPGVWVYGGQTRLHIRSSRIGNGNDGCDPQQGLELGQKTTVRLLQFGGVLKVFYDDVLVCATASYGRPIFPVRALTMYAADPWYAAADATLQNLHLDTDPKEKDVSSGATTFSVECKGEGVLSDALQCHPFVCGFAPDLNFSMPANRTRQYTFTEKAAYTCSTGYSVSGRSTGNVHFALPCNATGMWDAHDGCKKIDYCADSQCGSNGVCMSQLTSYTCDCNDGYESVAVGADHEKCVEIDECVTALGAEKCGENAGIGKCADGINGYSCVCNAGYESVPSDAGGASCSAKVCGDVPSVGNASDPIPAVGVKVSFPGTITYSCSTGYTTNGKHDGPTTWTVSCTNEGGFSGQEECKPVECGTPTKVHHASYDDSSLTYFETVSYTCDEGHTVDGSATGNTVFTSKCLGDGTFSQVSECKPVVCGPSPTIAFTTVNDSLKVFEDKSIYTCLDGYTMDGEAGGETVFELGCSAAGEFWSPTWDALAGEVCATTPARDGRKCKFPFVYNGQVFTSCARYQGVSSSWWCHDDDPAEGFTWSRCTNACRRAMNNKQLPSCQAVSCGAPEPVENAEKFVPSNLRYKEQVQITCKAGHTIDGSATGNSSFIRKCRANGKLSENYSCKPVECGVPVPTLHAKPKDTSKRYVYGEEATFKCNHGFSTDGLPSGGFVCDSVDVDKSTCAASVTHGTSKTFLKRCDSGGSFVAGTPGECLPIDFCQPLNPCGRNGNCTNILNEDGSPKGYQCNCMQGYEATKAKSGTLTCGEDDCAGHTCGQGGSCINLKDDYTCECMAGYVMVTLDDGEKTCRRKACGRDLPNGDYRPPAVAHSSRVITRAATSSKTIEVPDKATTLFVGDVAVYTCENGYSTDGSAAPAHKEFAVSCTDTGVFTGVQACSPVTCDQSRLPVVADSMTSKGVTTLFSFGDTVVYTCAAGHTVDGTSGAPNSFTVTCGADGSFDSPESCQPVLCGSCADIPAEKKSSASCPSGNLYAGEAKTLTCVTGYELPGGETTYDVSCGLDGSFSYPEHHICSPRSCGLPPTYANTMVVRPDESNQLSQGTSLLPMGQLTSDNGRFYAILGADGKFALYDNVLYSEGFGGELWSVNFGPAARLGWDNKVLELQTEAGTALWRQSVGGRGSRRLQVNNDGAMVMYSGSRARWSTGTGLKNTLAEGEFLEPQGRLTSSNGQFFAVFQADGTLVVYSRRQQRSVWSTETTNPQALRARIQMGVLKVCTDNRCRRPVWQSTQVRKHGSSLVLENDGTLAIVDRDGGRVWSSRAFDSTTLLQMKRLLSRARGGNPCAGRTSANFCYGHGQPTENGFVCQCACDKGYENDRCNRAVFKKRDLVLYEGEELEALTQKTLEQCTAACVDNASCRSFTYSPEDNSCSLRDKCVSPSEASAAEGAGYETYYRPCGFLTESVHYQCAKGTTTNGAANGARSFAITCNADGYSAGGPCQSVTYSVSGWVNDAPSKADIEGARVCAGTTCATTNAAGIFVMRLPPGSVRLTATAAGYIDAVTDVRVDGDIAAKTGADFFMVPVMAQDQMRFVLSWDSRPSDLDSHAFFGDETQVCHSCWYRTTVNHCARSGGVSATLERDFTRGFGPEVTYITGVGSCTNPQKNRHCRLHFKVKDYSKYYREAVGMGDSGAKVKVYRGDAKVGEYDVPRGVGNAWWWTVATVDLSTGKVFQGDANIEDPANAFVGPGAEWVVPEGKYTLKTPAGVAVQQEGNPVVRLRAEEPASKPGYYTVRSGTQCLNKEGKFADDCPPITLGVDGITARNSCVAPSVWMRMTYSACVASVTVAGAALMDSFAGDYADTSPDTLGWCPMIPCGAGKFRIAGSGKCPHVTEIVATPSGCAKMGGLMVDDVFCQMSLCESDPEGAESYALASASQCKPEDQQGAVGIDAQSTDMPYVLCSGAIEKSYKDNLFQILPLAGPNKVQVRNIATNRCLQASGDRIETTYCQFEDDEPLEEGRQWSYVNVPSVQTFRVFPEEAGAFL